MKEYLRDELSPIVDKGTFASKENVTEMCVGNIHYITSGESASNNQNT